MERYFKLILVAIFTVFVSGCAGTTPRIKTEVQETLVPLLHCPKPEIPQRPQLSIHRMTPEQLKEPGEVVKHYEATVEQLLGYTSELERIIQQYNKANADYIELRKKFEKWQEKQLEQ